MRNNSIVSLHRLAVVVVAVSKGMSSAAMFGAGRALQVDSAVASTIASMTATSGSSGTSSKSTDELEMNKAVAECVEMASQQMDAATLQNAKQSLFSSKSSST